MTKAVFGRHNSLPQLLSRSVLVCFSFIVACFSFSNSVVARARTRHCCHTLFASFSLVILMRKPAVPYLAWIVSCGHSRSLVLKLLSVDSPFVRCWYSRLLILGCCFSLGPARCPWSFLVHVHLLLVVRGRLLLIVRVGHRIAQ